MINSTEQFQETKFDTSQERILREGLKLDITPSDIEKAAIEQKLKNAQMFSEHERITMQSAKENFELEVKKEQLRKKHKEKRREVLFEYLPHFAGFVSSFTAGLIHNNIQNQNSDTKVLVQSFTYLVASVLSSKIPDIRKLLTSKKTKDISDEKQVKKAPATPVVNSNLQVSPIEISSMPPNDLNLESMPKNRDSEEITRDSEEITRDSAKIIHNDSEEITRDSARIIHNDIEEITHDSKINTKSKNLHFKKLLVSQSANFVASLLGIAMFTVLKSSDNDKENKNDLRFLSTALSGAVASILTSCAIIYFDRKTTIKNQISQIQKDPEKSLKIIESRQLQGGNQREQ
jgi:hypothetical protein